MLYIIVDPIDLDGQKEAQKQGAILVDQKVTYWQELKFTQELVVADLDVVETHQMSLKLRELSLQSGIYSRFHRDSNFGSHVYEELYTEWIEKSITKELARSVFVFGTVENALGMLTLGIKYERADIGLLAVDESARGKGVGQRLLELAKQRTCEWGFNALQVVTQKENKPACRFYERNGFHQDKLEFIYHLWLA